MSALCPSDLLVGRAEDRHRADRAALLPYARMRRSVHQPEAMEFEYLLLESADDEELFQHPDEAERILASPVRLRHLDAVPRRLHRDGNEPCHEDPPAGASKHLCWSAEISDGLHPIGPRSRSEKRH